MDYEKIIDIPFGAFDSELVYQEINIPDGFEATIEGNTIIFKKENKDEKIRKAIICGMNALKNQKKKTFATIPIDDCIDWLKKQGNKLRGKTALEAIKEEKVDNANKVEPKFKVGDWVVTNYGKVNQVVAIDDDCDGFTLDDGTYFSGSWKNYYHLWTIHDAKNGDVLVDVYGNISIYEKCDDFDWMSYCSLGHNGGFQHFKIEHENEKTYPATKEQRDLLFRKMKEAGYEWDSEKKELRIVQKPKWSDDDEQYLLVCKNALRKYQVSDKWDADIISKWLEDKLKQGKQGEKTSKWTEEDESKVEDIIYFLNTAKTHYASTKALDDCIDWLESLKQRMEEQQ